jgi:hypothetical protein
MTFLLVYNPLCGFSRVVCRHPSPRAVDESSDCLNRTPVESILGCVFGVLEYGLVELTIPILSPSPVPQLQHLSYRGRGEVVNLEANTNSQR